jgi:hypothetical protein
MQDQQPENNLKLLENHDPLGDLIEYVQVNECLYCMQAPQNAQIYMT